MLVGRVTKMLEMLGINTNHSIGTMHKLNRLFTWMICKAQMSSGQSCTSGTAKEQRNLQHSRSPRTSAEFLALPESRLM